uniref:TraX family protein n=1 Tax=Lentilactobacillus hilgardii TaxID=1588 RepID=UPI00403F8355
MLLEGIKKRGLTSFDIKILGITLMFIDHIHEMFSAAGVPTWVDMFGRPVATIFMFLSAEGFTHTHNKKRYLLRLLIGFWIMGIGNFVVGHFFSVGNLVLINNIFGDLFIGVLTMYGIQMLADGFKNHQLSRASFGFFLIMLPLVLGVLLLTFMQGKMADYTTYLMLAAPTPFSAENSFFLYLGPVLYLVRNHRSWQMIAIACFALLSTGFNFTNLLSNMQWMMVFSIIPLSFYNGQLGKSMKGFFYGFYPLHIWGLYILASLLGVGK